jgi:hypothetical protein
MLYVIPADGMQTTPRTLAHPGEGIRLLETRLPRATRHIQLCLVPLMVAVLVAGWAEEGVRWVGVSMGVKEDILEVQAVGAVMAVQGREVQGVAAVGLSVGFQEGLAVEMVMAAEAALEDELRQQMNEIDVFRLISESEESCKPKVAS